VSLLRASFFQTSALDPQKKIILLTLLIILVIPYSLLLSFYCLQLYRAWETLYAQVTVFMTNKAKLWRVAESLV
jgi:hypothetical protein